MKLCQCGLCFVPVCRAFLLARQAATCTLEPLQQRCLRLGTPDRLPTADRCKRLDAQINTDFCPRRFRWFRSIGFNLDAGKLSVSFPADRDALQLAAKSHVFKHSDPANNGQFDPLCVNAKCYGHIGGTKTVTVTFHLESWIFGTAFKKRSKTCAKVNNCFLNRAFRNVAHPRRFFALDTVQLAAQGNFCWLLKRLIFLPFSILTLPFGKRPISGKPCRAGRTSEIDCLSVI